MPYALVAIGLVLFVTAIKNTYAAMGTLIKGDFTGPGNFTYWLAAIGIVGLVGYYAPFRPLSRAFLILIIVVMLLRNGGFAQQLTSAIQNGPVSPPAAPIDSPPAATGTNAATNSTSSTAATAGKKAALAVLPLLA